MLEATGSSHHLLVSGTRRSGKRLLVRILSRVGLDTGFVEPDPVDPAASVGPEHDLRAGKLPYVVRAPALGTYAAELAAKRPGLRFDRAILCMRDRRAAAESGRPVEADSPGRVRPPGEGSRTGDPAGEEEVFAAAFHDLVHYLTARNVPIAWLHFPRFARSEAYFVETIASAWPGLPRESLGAAWRALVDSSLIHAVPGEEVSPPAPRDSAASTLIDVPKRGVRTATKLEPLAPVSLSQLRMSDRPLLARLLATGRRSPVTRPSSARFAEGLPALSENPEYLWPENEAVIAADAEPFAVPAIDLVALPNVLLGPDAMPSRRGRVITADALFPDYIEVLHYAGGGGGDARERDVPEEREYDGTAFVVSHANMSVYGHFLLEVLPKLLLAEHLRSTGFSAKIAFPAGAGAATRIVRQVVPADALLLYDERREKLRLRQALLPTPLTSPFYRFHPWAVAAIDRLAARIADEDTGPPVRIFISREKKRRSFRRLVNEAELFAVAADFGFVKFHPEGVPWTEQVRLFRRATHVIGEYTSALHNTMFCKPGTKVVSLAWHLPGVQSRIAASFRHPIGYVQADRKVQFVPGWTETKEFSVDASMLRRRLAEIA